MYEKIVALVVLLCAMMISSTASATETFDEQTPPNISHYAMERYFDKVFAGYEPPKTNNYAMKRYFDKIFAGYEPPKKDDEERRNEFYQLFFSIILTVGLVVILFAYKYSKNRQLIKENSFIFWLSNFIDGKNFWIFIFCIVSFVMSIFYVPYIMAHSKQNAIIKTAHATIFNIPKEFMPQLTKIDYQAIVFREVLILLGCCAGYTASTIIKKIIRRQKNFGKSKRNRRDGLRGGRVAFNSDSAPASTNRAYNFGKSHG